MTGSAQHLRKLLTFFFQAHPWHGIPAEASQPGHFHTYVELTPVDGVKYEVDKTTGHIRCDRPQKYSNLCPTLYGFIPRTYCGPKVGQHCSLQTERENIQGDADPIDICVLTEKPIAHIGILVNARPIGGLRMIDNNMADDKIIAVLAQDVTYGHIDSISQLPIAVIDRLRQYFLTYKQSPDEAHPGVEITHVYDAAEALQIIGYSIEDYREKFHGMQNDAIRILQELSETIRPGSNKPEVNQAD